VVPDPELDALARLAGTLSGGRASVAVGVAPPGALPLRGGDGEVRGGLLVTVPADGERRAALDQLAAHAGALLERRERESGLLDAVGALLRTNDELAAFAGRVAHDLRAPLTAVLGFLELANGPLRADPAEAVQSALAAAARMRVLVDDLFAYATFTARPRVGPVDLPGLVAAVTADLRADGRVRYAGVERVRSDATLVRQLVQNLVGNALTHAGPTAKVEVAAGATDGRAAGHPTHAAAGGVAGGATDVAAADPTHLAPGDSTGGAAGSPVGGAPGGPTGGGAGWWLRVVDDGPGIPVEARERVFDPFVRLGRTGSSGLGLATCARIVEALGGRIAVGDAEGGGAAFTATFP
jgi:signal transduction histidine kinase